MTRKTVRLAAIVLAVFSLLFFVYGSMKLVQSNSAAMPNNVSVEVPGVNVEVVDTGLRDRAATILGLSGVTLVATIAAGLYTLRPARPAQ